MDNAWRALLKWLVIVLLPAMLFLAPIPAGLTPQAWWLLAIFVGTILGLMLQPLPLGAMALVGLVAAAVTGALPAGQVFAGTPTRSCGWSSRRSASREE